MSNTWQCPYCTHWTTINAEHYESDVSIMELKNVEGPRHARLEWIVCANPECRRFTLTVHLFKFQVAHMRENTAGDHLKTWTLIPPSKGKVLPSYIPPAVVEDYDEAHAILQLSPKAAATLARRCLQGMIRDFWNIKKNRLIDEINELNGKVDADVWTAIDALRKVGNIGAHMEKDINVMVDVEPQEAEQLIALIELLIEEWYVARYQRQERIKAVTGIGTAKDAAKAGNSKGSTP